MAHDFNIIDKEPHFKIDATTRQITNELASEIAVVQFDHNSEVFTFELPRYIENHDMTECNKVEIHYRNTDPTSLAEVLDVYEVNDLQVDPTDENKAVCTWLISQNATQKVGKLEFLVRFSRVADDGTILYAWNTLMFTGIMISPGLYNSKQVSELYADVLEQWKTQLFSASAEGVENIYTARDSAIYDITDRKFNSLSHLETMRTKAISDIETKGAETLASIPNDYKTLYKKVGEHQTAIDTLNKGGLVLKDDVIGQHVEEWLGEHPEATTTVENDSVTVKKLFKKDLPFLTPEMFGAVGDGVTDDTKAIRDMVTYGKTYGVTSFIFGSAKTYIVSLPEIVMSNDWSTNTQRSQAVKNIINVNFANAKFDLNKSTIKLTGNMYPFYSIFNSTIITIYIEN